MYHPIPKYFLSSTELMEKIHYLENALKISKGKINMSWAYDISNIFEENIYLQYIPIDFQPCDLVIIYLLKYIKE